MSRLRPEERWLVDLRWLVVAGQVAVLIAAVVWPDQLGARVGGTDAATLAAAVAATQFGLWRWLRALPASPLRSSAVIAFDGFLLTGLLMIAGGAMNPFSTLYLVLVAQAALVLGERIVWAVTAWLAACYGLLYLPGGDHHHHLATHLMGMWVAFLVTAPLLVFGIGQLRRQLSRSRDAAARAQAAADRDGRLAALATLAAGAAHELATPLGTIAVVAREIERGVDTCNAGELEHQRERLRLDARLIHREIGRCREVVEQLSADAGSGTGELTESIAVSELIALGSRRWGPPQLLLEENGLGATALRVPPRLTARALHGLFKNALEASPEAPVTVRLAPAGPHLRIEVEDRGEGLSPAALERAGEPFFTTKEVGAGLGLGLFFARSVIEAHGGSIAWTSPLPDDRPGTLVTVELPRAEPG